MARLNGEQRRLISMIRHLKEQEGRAMVSANLLSKRLVWDWQKTYKTAMQLAETGQLQTEKDDGDVTVFFVPVLGVLPPGEADGKTKPLAKAVAIILRDHPGEINPLWLDKLQAAGITSINDWFGYLAGHGDDMYAALREAGLPVTASDAELIKEEEERDQSGGLQILAQVLLRLKEAVPPELAPTAPAPPPSPPPPGPSRKPTTVEQALAAWEEFHQFSITHTWGVASPTDLVRKVEAAGKPSAFCNRNGIKSGTFKTVLAARYPLIAEHAEELDALLGLGPVPEPEVKPEPEPTPQQGEKSAMPETASIDTQAVFSALQAEIDGGAAEILIDLERAYAIWETLLAMPGYSQNRKRMFASPAHLVTYFKKEGDIKSGCLMRRIKDDETPAFLERFLPAIAAFRKDINRLYVTARQAETPVTWEKISKWAFLSKLVGAPAEDEAVVLEKLQALLDKHGRSVGKLCVQNKIINGHFIMDLMGYLRHQGVEIEGFIPMRTKPFKLKIVRPAPPAPEVAPEEEAEPTALAEPARARKSGSRAATPKKAEAPPVIVQRPRLSPNQDMRVRSVVGRYAETTSQAMQRDPEACRLIIQIASESDDEMLKQVGALLAAVMN